MIYLALIVGCFLLYKGGDWLLDGVTDIGTRIQLPKAIIGLLLVSLGTSAPELFVSLGSAIQGHGALAAGNVVGSNIINSAVVLGIAALVSILYVERLLRQQLLAALMLTIVAIVLLHDGTVTRSEGTILLLGMFLSFAFAFRSNSSAPSVEDESGEGVLRSKLQTTVLTVGGIVALVVGAESLIWGGLGFAKQFGLSETIVALTVTALGTSLPEIAATVVAVVRREASLAVGNVVGSNILNIGMVLGLSALVAPLRHIEIDFLTIGFFAGLSLFIFAVGTKPGYYNRLSGIALIVSYFVYVVLLLMN